MDQDSPYAPPKAEIHDPQLSDPRLKRPTSSKWVLFYATAYFGVLIWGYIEHGASLEWWRWQLSQPWRILFQFYLLFSCIVLWNSRPRMLAYACGIMDCIFAIILIAAQGVSIIGTTPDPWASRQTRADIIVSVIFLSLTAWLFYRFTFGLPSRRYYGIGKMKDEKMTAAT